jgi:hypothetical protein
MAMSFCVWFCEVVLHSVGRDLLWYQRVAEEVGLKMAFDDDGGAFCQSATKPCTATTQRSDVRLKQESSDESLSQRTATLKVQTMADQMEYMRSRGEGV